VDERHPSSPAPPAGPPPASPASALPAPPGRIDFRRYRKLRRFVTAVFLRALWWDVLLNQPGLARLRPPALGRWRRIARRYRALAVEMGGVLIKLGQFLSVRVDLLPAEVIRELADLQDEVPPAPFAAVAEQIEAAFGRPVSAVFAHVDPVAVGAASLAQVHPATLPGGEEVVVKVLRPGIEVLVETDLAAVRLALRLLAWSRRIRRRVDLRRLGEEIVETTRRELDLVAEGRHAERFAGNFADDPRVRVPRIHWAQTTRRVLTMEDVAAIKISDLAALEAAGIDRGELARAVHDIYVRQVFVHHFVHADPHPGNLFVAPLSEPESGAPRPGAGRPFRIAFVDFGMVATIPQRFWGPLREYVIAMATRDAARLVRAYESAGVLLPGADLHRLIEIHEDVFERFWGVRMGELREVALSEARYFLRQYRDLLLEIPFQVQVELLFVSRAVGLVSGLATSLDPTFDPWAALMPFAERLAQEELHLGWRDWLDEGGKQARSLVLLPGRFERFLSQAERGDLQVEAALAADTRRAIHRLERAVLRLAWMATGAAFLIAATVVHVVRPEEPLDTWLGAAAAVALLWGVLFRR
jgi:predicted unusual protein kinase regulating ubiquinone biosynthesis (AarF/ABC1/UbiB family)